MFLVIIGNNIRLGLCHYDLFFIAKKLNHYTQLE